MFILSPRVLSLILIGFVWLRVARKISGGPIGRDMKNLNDNFKGLLDGFLQIAEAQKQLDALEAHRDCLKQAQL